LATTGDRDGHDGNGGDELGDNEDGDDDAASVDASLVSDFEDRDDYSVGRSERV
jgi:hypothetical protein